MVMMSISPLWVVMGLSLALFSMFVGSFWGVMLGLCFILSSLLWVYEDVLKKSVWDVGDWGLDAFKSGFLMFIFTECMFLFGALSSLLYVMGSEGYSILLLEGSTQDCMEVPLLISVILLTSGVSITAYHNMFHSSPIKGFNMTMMFVTISLGFIFLLVQYSEWTESALMWCDGFYGSIFYFITGFHGLHVMIGLLKLVILLSGLILGLGVNYGEAGFECIVWYWHFVDVVWLFVFLIVYWYSM
uniref:Cytochrome c oxidase subunit 3 n=1 Tax=Brentisentis yangtzensis TaxID=2604967 RepID=A0A5B9RTZ7_9BILA|nr:cytochrome c oxidase subunit 3 [Brentisentis yangtzensis]